MKSGKVAKEEKTEKIDKWSEDIILRKVFFMEEKKQKRKWWGRPVREVGR